jgi:hypothetical protein
MSQQRADAIAGQFIQYINEFHSYEQPYDDPLDLELHTLYAETLKRRKYFDFKTQPHFSPSSANSCERELYMKVLKSKRDARSVQPHQRRWTSIGTGIGDTIQREILLAERHYKKFTGEEPKFTFERTERNEPAFEDFVKTMKVITHKGKTFSLFGTCDGIMLYKTETGETLRVGLEIKSKQTTYAQTSFNSMQSAKEDHVKQAVCYSMMYNVDYYIILYVNASHKSWSMSITDYEKYPDIRAFGVFITDEMRTAVLDKFARILMHVEMEIPPKLELDKFTFNNFKTACVESLTEDEIEDIRISIERINKSRMPDWKKRQYNQTLSEIEDILNVG